MISVALVRVTQYRNPWLFLLETHLVERANLKKVNRCAFMFLLISHMRKIRRFIIVLVRSFLILIRLCGRRSIR